MSTKLHCYCDGCDGLTHSSNLCEPERELLLCALGILERHLTLASIPASSLPQSPGDRHHSGGVVQDERDEQEALPLSSREEEGRSRLDQVRVSAKFLYMHDERLIVPYGVFHHD